MILLLIAAFGLVVPNGLFIHWLLTDFSTLSDLFEHPLALAFMIDAVMTLGLLAYLFAVRPPGRVRWPWFVALSLLGGLGFSIPFYLWLNQRLDPSGATGFASWWRRDRG